MDNLLQKIKELVEAYNDLPNAERVAVVPEKLALEMNVPLQEDEKDISLFYICSYDVNRVGLFKELRYSSPKEKVMGYERWSAGSLFLGVESNLIGIKVTHEDFKNDGKVKALETIFIKDRLFGKTDNAQMYFFDKTTYHKEKLLQNKQRYYQLAVDIAKKTI